MLTIYKILGRSKELFINGFHTFGIQCTGIFNLTICAGLDDTTRSVLFPEIRVLRIKVPFGFFFRIQVVKIAKNSSKPWFVGRCWS